MLPYDTDEVTRLIIDSHDAAAFGAISHLTVGGFRDWLLDVVTRPDAAATLTALAPGLTPEMVAAVSKIMRNQDLIAVARGAVGDHRFRTTIGLPGRMSTRLQPNHPTDDPRGIAAATLDGLLLGCGDAVIGVNPATDSPASTADLLHLLDEIRAAVRHSDADLRAVARDDDAGTDRGRRPGRPGVPVDGRHRGSEHRVRH